MKLNDVEGMSSTVRKNCWEHTNCGHYPGGPRAKELGVCPVTVNEELHGAHGGKNAGRACWVIAGSLCGGRIQRTYAQKLNNCWRCEFFNAVKQQEDPTTHGFSARGWAWNGSSKRSENSSMTVVIASVS